LIEKYNAYTRDAHRVHKAYTYDRGIDLPASAKHPPIPSVVLASPESMWVAMCCRRRHIEDCIIDNIMTTDIIVIATYVNNSWSAVGSYKIAEAMEDQCPERLRELIHMTSKDKLKAYRNFHRGMKYGTEDLYWHIIA
jgi:hypothetical protein